MESPARPPPIIATFSLGLPGFGGEGSSGYKDLKGASFGETSFKTGPRSVTAAASTETIVSGGLSTTEIDSLFTSSTLQTSSQVCGIRQWNAIARNAIEYADRLHSNRRDDSYSRLLTIELMTISLNTLT